MVSFTTTLERFYEFYWRVVQTHYGVPTEEIDQSWKALAKQSERQLGAYVASRLILSKTSPTMPNPNTHVKFRNNVIHSGYIPTIDEAVEYGDFVLQLVRDEIEFLRAEASESLVAVYDQLSPRASSSEREDDDVLVGTVNILTAIDVKSPPKGDDIRVGGVERQLARVPRDRAPHGLELLSEKAMKKHLKDKKRRRR